jgi:hypothetical protein
MHALHGHERIFFEIRRDETCVSDIDACVTSAGYI